MTDVMTVTGPVAADDLGVTLPHEHVFLDLTREYRGNGLLNDPALAESELRRYVDAGGRTLVDVTTGGLDGDPAGLRRMAEAHGAAHRPGSGLLPAGLLPARARRAVDRRGRRPDRARHRGGHRRRAGRDHRRDRLRPGDHRARGTFVPRGGPRPPADRPDHHHPRRPLAGRHRPARPARRGGRRPGPRGHRALRHGARPRLPPGARSARGVGPVRHGAGRARVGHPAAAGLAAQPGRRRVPRPGAAEPGRLPAHRLRRDGRAGLRLRRDDLRRPAARGRVRRRRHHHADGRQPAPDAHRASSRPAVLRQRRQQQVARQRVGGAAVRASSSARPGSR